MKRPLKRADPGPRPGFKAEFDSLTGGATWLPVTRAQSITREDDAWGRLHWSIPPELEGESLHSDQVVIRITDYFDAGTYALSQPFRILSAGARTVPAAEEKGYKQGIARDVSPEALCANSL